jgi:hypothetical protein
MILHQLNDDSYLVRIVFDRDDSHDIGRIFSVRIGAVFVGQYETSVRVVHFDPLQINRIHDRSLKELDRREVSLDESFQFKVRRLAMQKHHFHVHIFSILVQKVLQEVTDRLVRDVTTDHDVPRIGATRGAVLANDSCLSESCEEGTTANESATKEKTRAIRTCNGMQQNATECESRAFRRANWIRQRKSADEQRKNERVGQMKASAKQTDT